MAVEDEVKAEYVKAINTLWYGSMQNNRVEYITDEVMRLMDEVFSQIRAGSRAMVGIDAVFNIFYDAASWAQIIRNARNAGKNIGEWIEVIRGNSQYKVVADAAALGYKSPVQIALYDAAMGGW